MLCASAFVWGFVHVPARFDCELRLPFAAPRDAQAQRTQLAPLARTARLALETEPA
tara:strand:+ start:53 stop:220 length:168 start_codon:yes stop_codon:yes gene_type:complete